MIDASSTVSDQQESVGADSGEISSESVVPIFRVAIVGLGPWGLCALERTAHFLRRATALSRRVEIHIVEPNLPGTGIYDVDQPDYLVMNNPCAEISFGAATGAREHDSIPSLFAWATMRGYRWAGQECRIDSLGVPIAREDFLPRRLMGEYLHWIYIGLVNELSARSHCSLHVTSLADLSVSERRAGLTLLLANGAVLDVDHAVLTVGHAPNSRFEGRSSRHITAPYPVGAQLEPILCSEKVAVLGVGLVGVDVVWALTVGRGGRFVLRGDGYVYIPSGLEPTIQLLSRSGQPYRSKTSIQDAVGFPERKSPIVLTEGEVNNLRRRGRGRIDFRTDVLPLLFAEMSARFYVHSVLNDAGPNEASAVFECFRSAHSTGRFTSQLHQLAKLYGSFDPESVFFWPTSVL